jgi:hypothetical protein
LGLPHKINLSNKAKTLFNFPDKILGEHIERGYHAMSLDEHREDFVSRSCLVRDRVIPMLKGYVQDVTKFHQTNRGKEMGQILRQVCLQDFLDCVSSPDSLIPWYLSVGSQVLVLAFLVEM